MNAKFQIGEIVVVQNQVGRWSIYNGIETQIMGIYDFLVDGQAFYQTDVPNQSGGFYDAHERNLRRREAPDAMEDQIVRALFTAPPVDRCQPVTAWVAQSDTADALMAMGVRVRPGKWPVEL